MTVFNFKLEPKESKAIFDGKNVKTFNVFVQGRNASVNDANKQMDDVMSLIYKKYANNETATKYYQITYKLSDGRWYSSKKLFNDNSPKSAAYPDLKDEFYGIDHSDDLVEFIKIAMVTHKN